MIPGPLVVDLQDVLLYRQAPRPARVHTAARSFSALSFRLTGESRFALPAGEVTAAADSVTFVPQGVAYTRTVRAEEEIVVFHFSLHTAAGGIFVFSPADPAPYRECFLGALREWEGRAPGYRYRVTAMFYEILARMTAEGAAADGEGSGDACDARYLREHFCDPALTVAACAAHACVSPAYFRRRFRALHGVSPKEYLDRLRIGYATSLLRTGYYTQTEVARRTGFSDVKYFRTAYRRRTGKTPSHAAYVFPEPQKKS